MKNNGYDQFFKKARKVAHQGEISKSSRQFSTSHIPFELPEDELEKQLKLRLGMKPKPKKKKRAFPWKLTVFSFVGLLVAAWGVQNFEEVENVLKRVEISFLGSAMAEEGGKKAAANEAAMGAAVKKEGDAGAAAAAATAATEKTATESFKALSDEEIDHLSKLNARQKELNEREEELARAEQELQAQKLELEKRLKDLEDVRRGISSVLEDKVKVDEKKIDTLVQMYSDMKPPQAAKVFETMDEDLAVEILGRMKKKNAADIMNLLKPEKAQILSEKFAGYKRK